MRSLSEQIALWFGIIMVLVVSAGAVAIITTDFLNDRLYGTKRNLFALVLIAYAVYRGYRIYTYLRFHQTKKERDEKGN